MGLTSHKPNGLLRFLFRLPIWFYGAGLGKLMGTRFLMLTHIGRNSGRERKVVLEVVAYDPEKKAYFVAAGWRGHADWFKNVQVNPSVTVTVGSQEFKATAQVVPVEEAAGIFHIYAFHHKQAFRELTRFMVGIVLPPDIEGCSQLAQSVPLVKLAPVAVLL